MDFGKALKFSFFLFSMKKEMQLVKEIKKLKNSKIKKLVDKRLKEFEKTKRNKKKVFSELCFCLLTANFNAKRAIAMQEKLQEDFLKAKKRQLAKKLKQFGHRYPNARASYIVEARKKQDEVWNLVKELKQKKITEQKAREWLVKNIKGLGYKEASHFLRNLGFFNLAILDFHILDLLEKYGLIKKPKTLTKRKYLEIEEELRQVANKVGLKPGILDLYLWFIETGKVLK